MAWSGNLTTKLPHMGGLTSRRTEISMGGTAVHAAHRMQYWWPLNLPHRVLHGNGEVRDIFPHLDEAQLD